MISLDQLESDVFVLAQRHIALPAPIIGISSIDLHLKPRQEARRFSYNLIVCQSVGQGACYHFDVPLASSDARDLVGCQFPDLLPISHLGLRIAIFDSIANALPRQPSSSAVLNGSSSLKAIQRAEIVCTEVSRVLNSKASRRKVTMVGYVELIASKLRCHGLDVVGIDYDAAVLQSDPMITSDIHEWSEFENEIQSSGAVLATGMTLATETLPRIFSLCNDHRLPLVLYCQTGSGFAPFYTTYGATSVVAEPFPFYTFGGTSLIEVYRT